MSGMSGNNPLGGGPMGSNPLGGPTGSNPMGADPMGGGPMGGGPMGADPMGSMGGAPAASGPPQPPVIPRNADVWQVLDSILNHKTLEHDKLYQKQQSQAQQQPAGAPSPMMS